MNSIMEFVDCVQVVKRKQSEAPGSPAQASDGYEVLSIRINGGNSDHHIWLNNGTWWMAFTIHRPDYTKQRLRKSLGTKCVTIARQRRDDVLAAYSTCHIPANPTQLGLAVIQFPVWSPSPNQKAKHHENKYRPLVA